MTNQSPSPAYSMEESDSGHETALLNRAATQLTESSMLYRVMHDTETDPEVMRNIYTEVRMHEPTTSVAVQNYFPDMEGKFSGIRRSLQGFPTYSKTTMILPSDLTAGDIRADFTEIVGVHAPSLPCIVAGLEFADILETRSGKNMYKLTLPIWKSPQGALGERVNETMELVITPEALLQVIQDGQHAIASIDQAKAGQKGYLPAFKQWAQTVKLSEIKDLQTLDSRIRNARSRRREIMSKKREK